MTLAIDGSGGSPGEGGGVAGKAERFFDRGRDVADACNFDYAIELFIHGLSFVPDHVPAHKELHLIALERKARGGLDIGNFDKLKLRETIAKSTDPLKVMLLAEKMLAFDPGCSEWIKCCAEQARQLGFARVADWFAQLGDDQS